MSRIDPQTVQKILDAADIVEVVSDFVTLKRKGSSYIGLCPFHSDRNPSFSVSKSRGVCKCFSCGKGGSAVGFIMEHEQLSYGEALRYLAKKYNIEIQERELTDDERKEETERESMLAVNEFALTHFEQNLAETPDGRNIGYAYFRERGINDASIKRFRLGYALEQRDALYTSAIEKGYNEKYLVETGLCIRTDRGTLYDRFKGRVIYPVFSLSGKVLAFGGRTLRKDKDIAKYVNSPESLIYHKSSVLYGLYQARAAIARKNKCLLVEGYMDVISMHQQGVENVVASSGTSLTDGQVRLIHRFTDNVTVIYDSDTAGIKASLRGIDMLIAEGLNIKVLLLPEGDDPDSFAQSHSASEVEEYISAHETDFISFKTEILLNGVNPSDPIERSRVITDIVRTIALVVEEVTRDEYVKSCSRMLSVDEGILRRQVARYVSDRIQREAQQAQRQRQQIAAGATADADTAPDNAEQEEIIPIQPIATVNPQIDPAANLSAFLRPFEQEVLRYLLKYGMTRISIESAESPTGSEDIEVAYFIDDELANDNMVFTNQDFSATYRAAMLLANETWEADRNHRMSEIETRRQQMLADGYDEIRRSASSIDMVKALEDKMKSDVDAEIQEEIRQFETTYIERALMSAADDTIRRVTVDLVSEKYHLSKVHSKFQKLESEYDRLPDLVPRAIYAWKDAILESRIREIRAEIAAASAAKADAESIRRLMLQHMDYVQLRSKLAKFLGERIISPRK